MRTCVTGWVSALLAGIVSVSVTAAEVDRCDVGFERGDAYEWAGPWGGGTDGGQGRGGIVSAKDGEFVRSGRRAVRMSVWDDGGSNAVAWAFMAEKHACTPGARIRAGAQVYTSSTQEPLPASAVAQVRIEYYYDRSCESQIPTHVKLSEPFSLAAGRRPDAWELVEVSDRVPPGATCLKITILLMAEHPGTKPGTMWVDDTFIEQIRTPGRTRADAGDEAGRVAAAHWWQRLCR